MSLEIKIMEVWREELYIQHHGILGQKWGKRNGPPYPINPGDHSAAEKKAAQNKRKGLTDEQKKKLIKTGVYAVGTALVAIGAYKLATDPSVRSLVSQGMTAIKEKPDILGFEPKDVKSVEITESNAASFAKDINPSHSTTNCGSCAAAILDNTNGGNSQALDEVPESMRIILSNGNQGSGYDPEKYIKCFTLNGKDVSWSDKIHDNNGSRRRVAQQLENELVSQGDGAKGIFYAEKIRGKDSGHYYFYNIIKGKVHVIEGQSKYLQKTGGDYSNLYEDIVQAFDCTDGSTGVYYSQVDTIKEEFRDLLLKSR